MKKVPALLMMTLLLAGCATPPPAAEGTLPLLTVTFVDVGSADCIVLKVDDQAAMIDTGHNGDAKEILAFLHEQGIEQLDFLLLTHLDKDHIGGADSVLKNIPIGTVYAPDYDKGNKQYDQYIDALETVGIQPIHPTEPIELSFGQGQLTLLPGAKTEYEQSNDYSIMAELSYGETSFLFAGDAEAERLTEYLSGEPRAFDVLKVPHHGRKSAQSEAFFTIVHPTNAVITCEKDDMPDDAVVNFLNSLGTEVYGTVYGAITITSDGTNLTVKQ